MCGSMPRAQAVAVSDGFISWIGTNHDARNLSLGGVLVIDCQGETVLPAFIDPHVHLLPTASTYCDVDCSPEFVQTVQDIQTVISKRANKTPEGEWVRGFGYDEYYFHDKNLTKWDLDQASPRHPVRIRHRSGHASIVNSVGLSRLNITPDTDEPLGSTIDRDPGTGEVSGFLIEMENFITQRMPKLSASKLAWGLEQSGKDFLANGITNVHDASPNNSISEWNVFSSHLDTYLQMPNVQMMIGSNHISEFETFNKNPNNSNTPLILGHCKILLTAQNNKPIFSSCQLEELVSESLYKGFPVAIHAVEKVCVDLASKVLASNNIKSLTRDIPNRIEHGSETSIESIKLMASSNVTVVSQPEFLRQNGDRYLHKIPSQKLRSLYPFNSLERQGITVAFSSDAPVTKPNPLKGIYSATTRKTSSGQTINDGEIISLERALRAYTVNAAIAGGQQNFNGTLEIGKQANIVLVSGMSRQCESTLTAEVVKTLKMGEIVWEK